MGCWSPLNAMKAYVHTLQLCKDYSDDQTDSNANAGTSKLIEPECVEFISALAAGNQSRLMIDVTSDGVSPSTLALAIAARHTNGRLICVCPDRPSLAQAKSQLQGFGLQDAVDFQIGDPCCVIKQYKNVDFAAVDHRIDNCDEVLFSLDMNPDGSIVVLSNLFRGGSSSSKRRVGAPNYVHMKKGSYRGRGIESAVLPVGGGMEVNRFGRACRSSRQKRSKRTFLVYEE
ncbi:uncharacterized protein A4U43_C04F27800 [Asparagus officinalis]|uniref:Uncharacterized protein n=1 Tax=Asparagus officinalis TaxID=4686 RepID=A0A5P1F923_ASPOF|nr:uncharacterized protein LOC109836092 [Asparagus officinalis]ONK73151.1 uncharacterized protein A4U43_C04F27800 [Asparagus officinalis]